MGPVIDLAVSDRRFLKRAVSYLVAEAGIEQILDIGTGLPTADNTHQVAQALSPEARVVYVDNDPLVLAHARALLTGTGRRHRVHPGRSRRPRWNPGHGRPHPRLRTAGRDHPAGCTALHPDDEQARDVVGRLVAAVPSGSYLAIAQGCHDINRAEADDIVAFWNEHGTPKIKYRSSAEIARFFDGLDLLDPGVVPCSRWRPGPDEPDIDVNQYCGVARKA